MTREEAERQAAQLNREHPDRATHRWLARSGDEGWEIVRLTLPAGMRIDPVRTTSEAKPKPAEAPDPRPAYFRDAGGPWVG